MGKWFSNAYEVIMYIYIYLYVYIYIINIFICMYIYIYISLGCLIFPYKMTKKKIQYLHKYEFNYKSSGIKTKEDFKGLIELN